MLSRVLASNLWPPIYALLVQLRKYVARSDYARWGHSCDALSPEWDERTLRLALLIRPHSSVIEFGAGRLVLKDLLPKDCTYTPSDIVDRGCGTIVCDLNSPVLPNFISYDYAVFGGVLEYVNNLPRLIRHISLSAHSVVASYAVAESSIFYRRKQGWVNDFNHEEILNLFASAGYHCQYSEAWNSQRIYSFSKPKL